MEESIAGQAAEEVRYDDARLAECTGIEVLAVD